jgi:hypothetical protein
MLVISHLPSLGLTPLHLRLRCWNNPKFFFTFIRLYQHIVDKRVQSFYATVKLFVFLKYHSLGPVYMFTNGCLYSLRVTLVPNRSVQLYLSKFVFGKFLVWITAEWSESGPRFLVVFYSFPQRYTMPIGPPLLHSKCIPIYHGVT